MSIWIQTLAGLVLLSFQVANCQLPPSAPKSQQIALSDIGRANPWPHIGAPPPPDGLGSREEQWQADSAPFRGAFAALKRSWTGEAVDNPSELRSKVGDYEDLVRTVTNAGGYGNLVLADASKRLSVGLLARYLAMHTSDYALVGEILETNRVRLLDCPAVSEMLMEELNLAPPSRRWHLSESQQELKLIYITGGSNFHDLGLGLVTGWPGPSTLIAKRNVSGLLSRLMADDGTERMVLAGLVEFLKRGGTLADLRSFDRVMGTEKNRFRFPPLGTDAIIGPDNIAALIGAYEPWARKAMPFSALVGD